MNPIIELQGIEKIYHIGGEDFAALAGITLNIEEGEFAALMGPSGSGKSTLIGFVFQNFNLLSRITALDNVALPLVYAGVGRKERTERAMDKLKSVGLETWAHHKPNELSGGQRQRVAIARALVNNPHIIMADEPTGNLDTKSTKDIMRLFEELHEDHKTIILVTHEPEIAACATRQLLLSDGKITKDAGKGVVMDVI